MIILSNIKKISLFSVIALVISGNGIALAQPVVVPPQQNAGVVLNHTIHQYYMREVEPWRYGPLWPEDVLPKKRSSEPLIEFVDTEIEAQIIEESPMIPVSE